MAPIIFYVVWQLLHNHTSSFYHSVDAMVRNLHCMLWHLHYSSCTYFDPIISPMARTIRSTLWHLFDLCITSCLCLHFCQSFDTSVHYIYRLPLKI